MLYLLWSTYRTVNNMSDVAPAIVLFYWHRIISCQPGHSANKTRILESSCSMLDMVTWCSLEQRYKKVCQDIDRLDATKSIERTTAINEKDELEYQLRNLLAALNISPILRKVKLRKRDVVYYKAPPGTTYYANSSNTAID